MINYMIELVSSCAPLWDYVLYDILALGFVSVVPCLLRFLIFNRG